MGGVSMDAPQSLNFLPMSTTSGRSASDLSELHMDAVFVADYRSRTVSIIAQRGGGFPHLPVSSLCGGCSPHPTILAIYTPGRLLTLRRFFAAYYH